MTFQHGGLGCAGGAGILGAIGIHFPDKHRDDFHDRLNDAHDSVRGHFGAGFGGGGGSVHDSITNHSPKGLGLSNEPLQLIFGNPALANSEHFSLAAIPVGAGVSMSIVALVAVICLALILATGMARAVLMRCSG